MACNDTTSLYFSLDNDSYDAYDSLEVSEDLPLLDIQAQLDDAAFLSFETENHDEEIECVVDALLARNNTQEVFNTDGDIALAEAEQGELVGTIQSTLDQFEEDINAIACTAFGPKMEHNTYKPLSPFATENLDNEMHYLVDNFSPGNCSQDAFSYGSNNGVNLTAAEQGELVGMSIQSTLDHLEESVKVICTSQSPKMIRSEAEATSAVEVTCKDVLLGRGHGAATHTGNQAFRHFVSKYRASYTSMNKFKKGEENNSKKIMGKRVFRAWAAISGRFLKPVKHEGKQIWVEASMQQAIKKIGMSLRQKETWKVAQVSTEAKCISTEADAFLRIIDCE